MSLQKFSSQADEQLLKSMKGIAHSEGRQFQSVLEEAMREYIEAKTQQRSRSSVMAHFRLSVEKNKRLGELLAK